MARRSARGSDQRLTAFPLAVEPRADSALLADHLAGDPEAFGLLFARHSGRLWAVALRICGDPADASDALQDGILRAMRAAASFQGRAAVSTWLHRIVTNCAIDVVRRRHPQVSLDDMIEGQGERAVSSAGSDPDMTMDIEAALAALPAGQRLAVYLVDYEGWSIAEAAVALGVAPGTVKSRCSRGRATLAPLLADYRQSRTGNHPGSGSVRVLDVAGGSIEAAPGHSSQDGAASQDRAPGEGSR